MALASTVVPFLSGSSVSMKGEGYPGRRVVVWVSWYIAMCT